MDLNKLFETQAKLDAHIVEEKELQGQDLLDKKILALQVELGELANEWRGFKFWSENQRSNTEQWVECSACDGTGDLNYEMVQEEAEGCGGHEYIDCEECDSSGTSHMVNPLLEEYVDCLHFVLSIGNEMEFSHLVLDHKAREKEITRLFIQLNLGAATLLFFEGNHEKNYKVMVGQFVKLGELLGFTWEQIEQAYFMKNKVNHERQANGY